MRVLIGAYTQLSHGIPLLAYERVVGSVLTPLLTLLHHRDESVLQLSLSMPLLQWMETTRNPLTLLLRDLCRSEKVELLGGTYHQSILSLINTKDRSNQIEMMTTYLRKRFGQRPKNFFSYGQIFNPSYLNAFTICCMETLIISQEGNGRTNSTNSEPYLMQELGKSITVIPTCDPISLAVRQFAENTSDFKGLLDAVHNTLNGDDEFCMAMINIDHLVQGGITEKETTELFSLLFDSGSESVEEILIPREIPLKGYLGAGWYGHDLRFEGVGALHDLFVEDESLAYLYGRYTAMVEHARLYKKDKDVRKRLESLIQKASSGAPFLFDSHAAMLRPSVRAHFWRYISEVDSILSSLKDWSYPLVYDYDHDEVDEHLVISKNLSCVVDSKGGSLAELTYLPSLHNYGDAYGPLTQLATSRTSLHPPRSGEKRRLFSDVILASGAEIEEYDKSDSSTVLDLGRRRYNLQVLDRRSTEFRATLVSEESNIIGGQLSISKHFKIRQNTVLVEVVLTNLSEKRITCTYGCEIPLSISVKTLPMVFSLLENKRSTIYESEELVLPQAKSIKMIDEPNSTAVTLISDTRFTLLKEDYTIDITSTLGDEHLYQHTLFMPSWPLELESGQERRITLGLRLERK